MRSLTYPAAFPDRFRTVKIVELSGGHGWQLYLDDYYQGVIHLVRGELVAHLSLPVELQGDDIGAVMEVINKEFRSEE